MRSVSAFAAGARFVVGMTLFFAGALKATALDNFAKVLRAFPITRTFLNSHRSARRAARALSWVEIVSGALLALGLFSSFVEPFVLILLVGFSLGIASALRAKERVACGCFGDSGDQPVSHWSLLRNVTLVGLVLAGVLAQPVSLDGVLRRQLALGTYLAYLTVFSEGFLLLVLVRGFLTLRAVPLYGQEVPKVEAGSLAEVWEGARELRSVSGGQS